MSPTPHLTVHGVHKRFGGVYALKDVTVKVARGTVHAIVGENGAGKSTLGKVVAGIVRPDGGTVMVDGRAVDFRSPRDALESGITTIAQELSLVPHMSVCENVMLGIESNRSGIHLRRSTRRRYEALVREVGFELPDVPVVGLRLADQQQVEILRALARNAEFVVMDEPTAALGARESATFLESIKRLRARGTTVVFVSHFLDQVLAVADTITILKDGMHVRTAAAAGETAATLVESMLGRAQDAIFPAKRSPAPDAPVVLSTDRLTGTGRFSDVSLTVRAGEIVGIAGLVGSGRSRLLRALAGVEPVDSGTVHLHDVAVTPGSPREAQRLGVALIPESRKHEGLLMRDNVLRNVTLPHLGQLRTHGLVSRRKERRLGGEALASVGLSASPQRGISTLSGGNQQRVVFAKWLFGRPRVLLADQPTRGIDMGARESIYTLLTGFADQGMGLVIVSDDVSEVMGLAHRILVMRRGRVIAEFDGLTATEADVTRAALDAERSRAA